MESNISLFSESVDCAKKFEILQQNVQRLEDESELLAAIDGNVALLSGELTMLWRQFLELFRGREEIRQQLAKEHHTARVRRLAEGFFSGSECASTSTLIDFSNVGRVEKTCERLEEQLRKSTYFQCLPPLGVYCEDLDGSPELLPVVFEQRYQPAAAPATPPDSDEITATVMKHSQSAKIATALANVMEAEAKRKDILKGTLSLDLPHVHRPAKQQQKIASVETTNADTEVKAASSGPETEAEASQTQDQPTKWKATRMGSCRKPLFSRSASFRLWRRQRRLHTFPLTYSEMGRYETGPPASSLPQKRALVHCSKIFRSTPDLKGHPQTASSFGVGRPLDIEHVSVNFTNRRLDTSSAAGLDDVFRMAEKRAETTKSGNAFSCLNCCHSVDLSAVTDTEETVATVIIDNGHQSTTKEEGTRATARGGSGRRTSSLSGDEDERQVGVSFGLDALALENERNLIVSPGQMPTSVDSVPRLTSGIEQELLE